MTAEPRFSITIPAYNAETTLAETLDSVVAQTYSDWEVVVCDDGSTDGTRALAESYAARDARVRVVAQENRGSGGAYNTAVRASRGALVVMLSADDLLLPDHLARFDAFVRDNPAASVFTCDGWYENEDGRREEARPPAYWVDAAECTLEDLVVACFYGVGAVYRRPVFDAVGGFREDLYAEDYLFWLQALAPGFRHKRLAEPLSVHRRSGLQKSSSALRMRETDLRVISEILASDALTPMQVRATAAAALRLERTILARRVLAATLGDARLELLLARARAHRRRSAAVASLGVEPDPATRTMRGGAEQATSPPGATASAGVALEFAPTSLASPRAVGLDSSGDPLRIAFLNNFAGPTLGGGEVQLLALLPGLVAAGVRPTVVCAAGSGLEREARHLAQVAVVPVDFSPRTLPKMVAGLPRRLRGVELVQGTGFLTNLAARAVGGALGVPIINTVHVVPGAARHDGESRSRSAARAALEHASRLPVTRFVAVSEAVRDGLVADGVVAARISVVANGVDVGALRAAAATVDRSPRAGRRVGYLGRLEPVKGGEYFVTAAALLAGDDAETRFVVAGTGTSEPLLWRLAAELGLADRLEFAGYASSAPAFLGGLDVVVVPSLSEASGLTAMEALALGVPVVATRVGGLPEVIADGETGLLVPPADPGALAAAVRRLLGDPELAGRLAAAGADRVAELFTVERMVAGYVSVYEELVPGWMASGPA